jgi:Uma2 family endonuclease
MARDVIAPWAEAVPQGKLPMTAAELARLPDDARGYELVDGRLVRMSPTSGWHSVTGLDLGAAMRLFTKRHGLGQTLGAEVGFLLSEPGQPDTVLAPDAAFVRADRVPPRNSPEGRGYWRLAPDLIVEVASPSQSRPELAAKAQRWLAAGTRLVWIVWPDQQQVDVWRHSHGAPALTLSIGDSLDGEEIIPGFRYALAELFA